MTGGYQLLVPAALAITVGYVVQKEFSVRFKYPTLYEGQVEGRPDSPAHQVEHLETAIQLLAKRQVNVPETISHVDLRTLLETGIPIDLPGDRRLLIETIEADSAVVGKRAYECFPIEHREEVDLVVVFRKKKLVFPHEGTRFQVGDRLLLIISYKALQNYQNNVSIENSVEV